MATRLLRLGTYDFPATFYPASISLPHRVAGIDLPRAHGARLLPGLLSRRGITLRGGLCKNGDTYDTFRTRFDALKAALYASVPSSLYLESDRYLRLVQVESIAQSYGATHHGRIEDVEIALVAADPYYYSEGLYSDTWASPTNAAQHAITIAGDAPARPKLAITIGGAGTQAFDFDVTHAESGDVITLAGSLTGGSVILVDCLLQTCIVGVGDQMALFDGTWLALGAGTATLETTIRSGTLTSIVTTWRNRWY